MMKVSRQQSETQCPLRALYCRSCLINLFFYQAYSLDFSEYVEHCVPTEQSFQQSVLIRLACLIHAHNRQDTQHPWSVACVHVHAICHFFDFRQIVAACSLHDWLSTTGVDALFLVCALPFTQQSLVHCRSKPQKGRKNHHFGSILSHELQEFLGVESMPRTQVICCTCDRLSC